MKRLLLALVLLAAGTAWAEWVRMGEDSGQITHFFDPKTISKDANLRTVRWLEESRTKDATGVLSTRSMYEFDCQQERRRTLAFSSHPERWANGKTIRSGHRPSDWEAVPVDSFADAFRKLVCSR